MTLRRASQLVVDQGVVASYVHNAASPGMGQAGALVGIKTDATGDKLAQVRPS
jgi:elongation factor Ts